MEPSCNVKRAGKRFQTVVPHRKEKTKRNSQPLTGLDSPSASATRPRPSGSTLQVGPDSLGDLGLVFRKALDAVNRRIRRTGIGSLPVALLWNGSRCGQGLGAVVCQCGGPHDQKCCRNDQDDK